MPAKAPARFSEIQRFQQWWIIATMVLPAALFLYGIVQQILLGNPFGDQPLSDTALLLAFLVFVLFFLWFILVLRLETEVDETGIHYKFRGIHFKRQSIPWQEVASAELVTYKPLREYGGWGIRYGFHGKAYSVSGKKGIQLQLNSGAKILIGSRRGEEFYHTLRLYFPVSR
jgi:hypothetical protein